MAQFKQLPCSPQQVVLFSVSLEETVAADCDVRLLSEAMELLDWRELEASYKTTGCPAYPPKLMAKLLMYGYSKGVRSSRKLEEAAQHDLRYIWLLGGFRPDHATIARFRRKHESHLKQLFVGTVRLCAEAGLVLLNCVATDGSRIQGRASKRSLYDKKRLAKELAAVEQILAEAEAIDQAEEAASSRAGTIPEALKDAKCRQARLAEIAARLEKSSQQRVSASDPDCKVVRTGAGFRPGYNAQVTVDSEHHVIVAAELICQQTDNAQLSEQLKQVAENLGLAPDLALADSGYSDEETFQWLEDTKQQALVPPREQAKKQQDTSLFGSRCFLPVAGEDALICPAGRKLTLRGTVKKGNNHYREYTALDCRGCSFSRDCIKGKKRRRSLQVSIVEKIRDELRQKLKTPQGQAQYRIRAQTVEPTFGNLKANLGFWRFLLAGKVGASAEFWLICIAHNLLIWVRKRSEATKSAIRQRVDKICTAISVLFWPGHHIHIARIQ